MNFTRNIILVICITINLGVNENHLFIKPSASFMQEKIFTNQANWNLVNKNKGIKVFPQCINLYDGNKTKKFKGEFQIRMPLPDLVAVLKGGPGKKKGNSRTGYLYLSSINRITP